MKAPKTYLEAMELAERMKAKEKAGVIGRIRAAIAAYELTPADLFDEPKVPAKRRVAKKKAGKPRAYSDGMNTWSGYGTQPAWLREAIASGKTLEELAA